MAFEIYLKTFTAIITVTWSLPSTRFIRYCIYKPPTPRTAFCSAILILCLIQLDAHTLSDFNHYVSRNDEQVDRERNLAQDLFFIGWIELVNLDSAGDPVSLLGIPIRTERERYVLFLSRLEVVTIKLPRSNYWHHRKVGWLAGWLLYRINPPTFPIHLFPCLTSRAAAAVVFIIHCGNVEILLIYSPRSCYASSTYLHRTRRSLGLADLVMYVRSHAWGFAAAKGMADRYMYLYVRNECCSWLSLQSMDEEAFFLCVSPPSTSRTRVNNEVKSDKRDWATNFSFCSRRLEWSGKLGNRICWRLSKQRVGGRWSEVD